MTFADTVRTCVLVAAIVLGYAVRSDAGGHEANPEQDNPAYVILQ